MCVLRKQHYFLLSKSILDEILSFSHTGIRSFMVFGAYRTTELEKNLRQSLKPIRISCLNGWPLSQGDWNSCQLWEQSYYLLLHKVIQHIIHFLASFVYVNCAMEVIWLILSYSTYWETLNKMSTLYILNVNVFSFLCCCHLPCQVCKKGRIAYWLSRKMIWFFKGVLLKTI